MIYNNIIYTSYVRGRWCVLCCVFQMGEESGLAVYIMYHQFIIESDIVYIFYDV